jgi:hypothetical protein
VSNTFIPAATVTAEAAPELLEAVVELLDAVVAVPDAVVVGLDDVVDVPVDDTLATVACPAPGGRTPIDLRLQLTSPICFGAYAPAYFDTNLATSTASWPTTMFCGM